MMKAASLLLKQLIVKTIIVPKNQSNFLNASKEWSKAAKDFEFIFSNSDFETFFNDPIIKSNINDLETSTYKYLKDIRKVFIKSYGDLQILGSNFLLFSKTMENHKNLNLTELHKKQCTLIEIIRMLYMGNFMHNINSIKTQDSEKLSILIGDFLLALVFRATTSLKSFEVYELMASTVEDHVKGRFIKENENYSIESWEKRIYLLHGSLQSKAFKSISILSNADEYEQNKAFEIGKKLMFAIQATKDLNHFIDNIEINKNIEMKQQMDFLHLLPVILCGKERNSDLLSLCQLEDNKINFKLLKTLVHSSDAIEATKHLINGYVESMLSSLAYLKNSEEKIAFTDVISSFNC